MKLIVGLGNPGPEYQLTRHNAGFRVVERLGIKPGAQFVGKKDLFCDLCRTKLSGSDLLLAKPNTYMNLSGKAVSAIINWYKIPRSDLLVVHDDVSLPLGKIRLQKGGGAGGQHGVESIIECFGGLRDFDRLKFGIGPDPGGSQRAKFVLAAHGDNEKDLLEATLSLAVEASVTWLCRGIDQAMNSFNGTTINKYSSNCFL